VLGLEIGRRKWGNIDAPEKPPHKGRSIYRAILKDRKNLKKN